MNYHPIIDRMKRIAELLPTAIGGITPSGTKTINITQNGTVTEDVTNYANAEVITNVPQGVFPSGTKTINVTQNGTVTENVTNYANAQVNVNVPLPNVYIEDVILATRNSGNVPLCTLPDNVYSHRNDTNFSITLINITPSSLENYDDYYITVCNNADLPKNANYTIHGVGLRNSSNIAREFAFYPPNSTNNTNSLGGIGKFWLNNKVLTYKSSQYWLGAGTLRIIITW